MSWGPLLVNLAVTAVVVAVLMLGTFAYAMRTGVHAIMDTIWPLGFVLDKETTTEDAEAKGPEKADALIIDSASHEWEGVGGVLAMAAWPFHDWLLRADAFHYWTPFLDPSQSQLSGFK